MDGESETKSLRNLLQVTALETSKSHTNMESKKTNGQPELKHNRRWMPVVVVVGWVKWLKGVKKYKLPVIKYRSHRDKSTA